VLVVARAPPEALGLIGKRRLLLPGALRDIGTATRCVADAV